MKNLSKIIIFAVSTISFMLIGLILEAGGWDNFKLKYFHLTSYFHNQKQELQDIQAQNINLEKNSRINLDELLNGGPPKDGIPSIDNPEFTDSSNTAFSQEDLVIGVVINGQAKAYPLGIMNWHEIVNDTLNNVNISVSYCPLCDTIIVFNRGETTYGVSGKLYQSCLVMYNRDNDSLYAQPWAMGIIGVDVNHNLSRIPAVKTTLEAWLKKYPDSKILSTNTGYDRDYQNYPYGSYYTNDRLVFPVRNQEQLTSHPKEIISYIFQSNNEEKYNHFSGESYQVSHQDLQQEKEKIINWSGRKIRIKWEPQLETVIFQELDGKTIPSSTAFAFVYPAFFDQ